MSSQPAADARLFDRGFQPYEGVRTGVRGAAKSLLIATVQRALGFRRRGREKFLPFLVIAIAFLPALVIIALSVIFPDPTVIPHYSQYYNFIATAILLFTALVAPESVCNDRRSGLLSLYLASALTRAVYVATKASAVATVLLIVTIGPLLLTLVGLTFTGSGPDDFVDAAGLVGRILAAGIVISLFFTAVAISVASLTDRRAIASAGIIMLVLGTGIAAGILVRGLGGPEWLQVIDLTALPFELAQRIYGRRGDHPNLETWLVVTAGTAWALVGYGIAWIRYQEITVTR